MAMNYRSLEVNAIKRSKDGNTITITGTDLDKVLINWDEEFDKAEATITFDLTKDWQVRYLANMVRSNKAAYGAKTFNQAVKQMVERHATVLVPENL